MKTQWYPLDNKKRKFKGHTRHFKATCPYCLKRKKNVVLHMKTYHVEEYLEHDRQVKEALLTGSIGYIDGIRFVSSNS